jgi:DNA-binding CsgD family transcriptional regulator
MADQEAIHKLRLLSRREREVLKLFCEGKAYKTIGENFFIDEDTVKTHMGHIYIKLGIRELPVSARRMVIYQTYCPAIHDMDLVQDGKVPVEPEPEELESMEPEPVPDEVIDMVNQDEKALVVVEPEIIEIPPYNDEPKTKPTGEEKKVKQIKLKEGKKKRRFWRWMLFIMIIALIVFGGMQVYSWACGFLNNVVVPMIVQETPEVIPTQGYAQPTKEAVVVPTNTAIPPTPAPTKTPSPKISLPFYDNFSNGISSPWSVGYGNWFVTDSGASISISDLNDDTGSIVLDDPTLTDYKVKVKVHTPHMWSANQGQFGVIVRYGSNRDQNIIFYMNSNGRFKWAYIDSLSELSFYQPDITGVDKDAGSTDVTLEIEVIGNTFIAKVNGAKIDQFSMTGYEKGGVVLMTKCGNVGSCPSFSDLSIEPVN